MTGGDFRRLGDFHRDYYYVSDSLSYSSSSSRWGLQHQWVSSNLPVFRGLSCGKTVDNPVEKLWKSCGRRMWLWKSCGKLAKVGACE